MASDGKRRGPGRPKGSKNKVTEQRRKRLSELANEYTESAVQTLADVMQDNTAPHNARVNAANAILDRAHGRPVQSMEHSGPDGRPIQTQETSIDVSALSDQALEELKSVRTHHNGSSATH